MTVLTLAIRNFRDLSRWQWELAGPTGEAVAFHEVELDPAEWQFAAFRDPYSYLIHYAAPFRRAQRETEILTNLGGWVADRVFGPLIEVMARHAPATVRVAVPEDAAPVMLLPLELAMVEGVPLGVRGISLVFDAGDAPPPRGGTGPPRVLGLFSQPDGGSALNMRRERHRLATLLAGSAEFTALQYGVTPQLLSEVVAEGWDAVHLAGHGGRDVFRMEGSDGRPLNVTSGELSRLLSPLAGVVRLITVTSCSSAAGAPEGHPPATGALAVDLARRLGCAVTAMRFPVDDDFVTPLTIGLYRRLIIEREPLPRALTRTLGEVASSGDHRPLSLGAPALFGAGAADLVLAAPEVPDSSDGVAVAGSDGSDGLDGSGRAARRTWRAGLPEPPERFVGRVGVMTRASAALAPLSGRSGVLLYGMPGIGTTACALELAHTHRASFDDVRWLDTAGGDLAPPAGRSLLVIDGMDALVDEEGRWLDPQAGAAITRLAAHDGPGRVILTSHRPLYLGERMLVERVSLLAEDEAYLLAREIPGFADLMRDSTEEAADWLEKAGGHPALVAARGDDGGTARALTKWTGRTLDRLEPAAGGLLFLLSALEEADRLSWMLEAIWRPYHERLPLAAETPLDALLLELETQGLIMSEPDDDGEARYRVHPVVAAAVGDRYDADARRLVDILGNSVWLRVGGWVDDSGEPTGEGTAAAVRGLPYMVRLGDHIVALYVLSTALTNSRALAAEVLPFARRIRDAVQGTPDAPAAERLLSYLTRRATPQLASEADLEAAADWESARERFAALTHAGRTEEALALLEGAIERLRGERGDRWWMLAAEADRLDALAELGRSEEVLAEVDRLWAELPAPTALPPPDGGMLPASAVEHLLAAGRRAAMRLRRWDDALRFAQAVADSEVGRGADNLALATTWLSMCGPLHNLGRSDEAYDLLLRCKEIFEADRDPGMLAEAFNLLSAIEYDRGHVDLALTLRHDALRFSYLDSDAQACALNHNNLGNMLSHDMRDPAGALVQHLAAAVIRTAIGHPSADDSIQIAACDLLVLPDGAYPLTMSALSQRVMTDPVIRLDVLVRRLMSDRPRTPGFFRDILGDEDMQVVDLNELLSAGGGDVDAAFQLLERQRETGTLVGTGAAGEDLFQRVLEGLIPVLDGLAPYLARCEPLVAAVLEAESGNDSARRLLEATLDRWEEESNLRDVATALRRITEGERELAALASYGTLAHVVALRVLRSLEGAVTVPAQLWHAAAIDVFLHIAVQAARGDYPVEAAVDDLGHLAATRDQRRLTRALRQIAQGKAGDRRVAAVRRGPDRAVVDTVLHWAGFGPARNAPGGPPTGWTSKMLRG
ncbi:CHAT domain-containing protein [Microbispora sp. NPDC049125]|uniref:CHAT domain-containing protein n=1 Tax=Microbispora sp. NPDC049125 TaxID=3154929 RepID=UPI003465A83F